MRKLCICLLACLPTVVAAQDYVMYETFYVEPEGDQRTEYSEAMAAHNRQFHSEGAYQATVWQVVTGPRSGQHVWGMGPCTFADLDGRPSGELHDSDWAKVLATLEEFGEIEYWRLDPELSYTVSEELSPVLRVRFFDAERSEGYRLTQLMSHIKEVYEKKSYPNNFHVYRNRFISGSGRDVATVSNYQKWADLDRQSTFVQDYEEVHGEESWRLFLEELEEAVVSIHDEYRELLPALSGMSTAGGN